MGRSGDDRTRIDGAVFGVSVLILSGFTAFLMAAPERMDAGIDRASAFLFAADGLVLNGVVLATLVFVGYVLISPWGTHRLGGEDATPEFGMLSYVAMLFSAGVAAGIVFWGPAEALFHASTPPPGSDVAPGSDAAATTALQQTMFHWGISAWALYVAFGIVIAYAVYDRGAPLRVSAILAPILGTDRLDGPLGTTVDIVGVVAPLVGITATVGQVSEQFLTGVEYRWSVELTDVGVLVFMLALVCVFTVSAVTGVHRGIRRLSLVNVGGFILLGGAVFVLGPTTELLSMADNAIQGYLRDFGAMSTASRTDWADGWTLFYWAWWLSWTPFVGLFIARISRGRTLRTVVLAGVGVTSVATMAWYLVVGGTALQLDTTAGTTLPRDEALAGFVVFELLAAETLLLVLFLALIVTFLVTSADSLILAIGFQTTARETTPAASLRLIWGGLLAGMTTALVLVGGTEIAESATIVAGGVVMVLLACGMVGLVADSKRVRRWSGRETEETHQ